MITWTLAVVLFGCLGLAGFSFGAIRASISFIGIFVSLLLARIFGHMLQPLLGSAGMKNPIISWLVAPVIVFVIGMVIFKCAGYAVHKKVDLYYKYKAGDLRMALWQRLNARLGLCVGLLNGAAYLVLISMVIFILSQVTYQLAQSDAKWPVRLANAAGKELQSSGMVKVAAAIEPMPAAFYQAADLAGLIYHNPLTEARLAQYPAFLSLGEKSEFQQLGNDNDFTQLWQRQAPVADILHHPKMEPIVSSPDMLKQLWSIVQPNMSDLEVFLSTGKSPKYDAEPLLGRWDFNLNAAVSTLIQAKPDMRSAEMKRDKALIAALFDKTMLVATPEKDLFFKNVGKVRPPPPGATPAPVASPPRGATPAPAPTGRGGRRGGAAPPATMPPAARGPTPAQAPAPAPIQVDMENFQGKWEGGGGTYQLKFGNRGTFDATVQGDKLVITGYSFPIVLDREF